MSTHNKIHTSAHLFDNVEYFFFVLCNRPVADWAKANGAKQFLFISSAGIYKSSFEQPHVEGVTISLSHTNTPSHCSRCMCRACILLLGHTSTVYFDLTFPAMNGFAPQSRLRVKWPHPPSIRGWLLTSSFLFIDVVVRPGNFADVSILIGHKEACITWNRWDNVMDCPLHLVMDTCCPAIAIIGTQYLVWIYEGDTKVDVP